MPTQAHLLPSCVSVCAILKCSIQCSPYISLSTCSVAHDSLSFSAFYHVCVTTSVAGKIAVGVSPLLSHYFTSIKGSALLGHSPMSCLPVCEHFPVMVTVFGEQPLTCQHIYTCQLHLSVTPVLQQMCCSIILGEWWQLVWLCRW